MLSKLMKIIPCPGTTRLKTKAKKFDKYDHIFLKPTKDKDYETYPSLGITPR